MSEHPSIEGYELIELLGRNGHLIYLARQSSTGRLVRLNVVRSGGDFGRAAADSLRRQAELLATLDHPNILELVEMGDAPGHGFFSALEHIEGGSLAEVLHRQESFGNTEVVQVVRQVAAALDYAHERHVVHGHLHPKHILRDPTGHVFLIGFGEADPKGTQVALLGNPHFLASEQIDGSDRITPQTDIYALSEVVFLLLSGVFPFRGPKGIEQLLKRKLSSEAPSIRRLRSDLPRKVDSVLKRGMALRPEDRFQSASQFLAELADALRLNRKERGRWWQFWR